MISIYDKILYVFNIIILIFGIIFITYSIENFNNNLLYCDNLYFVSITIIINSIICLVTITNLKITGLITTLLLFSYNIYNIVYIHCTLKKYIFISYIILIIISGVNILLYITSYLKNKVINNNELPLI